MQADFSHAPRPAACGSTDNDLEERRFSGVLSCEEGPLCGP